MTTPIRDVVASFDTNLDELRQARALQAIHRRLDAVAVAGATSATITLAWPLAIAAAIAGAFAMWLVMRVTPESTHAQLDMPPAEGFVEPVEARARTTSRVETPEPAVQRTSSRASVSRPEVAADVAIDVAPEITAAELYRRAETALAAHDRASASALLQRLLTEFSTSGLVDAAHYDLALIAIANHDEARALVHLDDIIASGRDPNIVAAARRMRRVVMARRASP